MPGPLLAAGDTTANKRPESVSSWSLLSSGRRKTINEIQKLILMACQMEVCAVNINGAGNKDRREKRTVTLDGQGRPTEKS